MLNHLAIIMDGNRRWGKKNSMSLQASYETGAQNVKHIVEAIIKKNIKNLTLYTLSKENLNRPDIEIKIIFSILLQYIENEIENFKKNGIRLKIIGNLSTLPDYIRKKIIYAQEQTAENSNLNLFIAFSYSGREEIIDAVKAYVQNNENIDNLNEESLTKYMYATNMPEVDLLIRTGGDMRISNFLLWHIKYAELYFTKKYWPEFSVEQLDLAINEYNLRKRNFGVR